MLYVLKNLANKLFSMYLIDRGQMEMVLKHIRKIHFKSILLTDLLNLHYQRFSGMN